MFPKLSRPQILILILLGVLIIVLLAGPLVRLFNSWTAAEYEPWDPDNELVLKNSIAQLNQEGEQINQRLTLFSEYKGTLDEAYKMVSKPTLDTPYTTQMEAIQPYTVLGEVIGNSDAGPPSAMLSPAQTDNVLGDVNRKVRLEGQRYITEYEHLLDQLGLASVYNVVTADYKIRLGVKGIMLPVTRKDSIKLFGDSILTAISPPPQTEAKRLFQAGTANLLLIVGSLDTVIIDATKKSEERRAVVEANLSKLRDDFNKKNFSINKYAVIIGIPFFILAALLMYWFGIRASNNIAKEQGGSTDDFKLGLSFTLNTITVLLLILSLLILGLAKVVQENTLAALLGAIAGYILNNATDKSAAKPAPAAVKPPEPQPQAVVEPRPA